MGKVQDKAEVDKRLQSGSIGHGWNYYNKVSNTRWLYELEKGRLTCWRKELNNKNLKGREPRSSGYGRRLMFQRSWVWIPAPYTGHFLHFFVVKSVLFGWKDQNKWKGAWNGPLKNFQGGCCDTVQLLECFLLKPDLPIWIWYNNKDLSISNEMKELRQIGSEELKGI